MEENVVEQEKIKTQIIGDFCKDDNKFKKYLKEIYVIYYDYDRDGYEGCIS